MESWPVSPLLQAIYSLLIMKSTVVLFMIRREFIGRPPRKWLPLSGTLNSLWTVFALAFDLPFIAIVTPAFAFLSFAYILVGCRMLKHTDKGETPSSVVGWLFIFWGVHQAESMAASRCLVCSLGLLLGSVLAVSIAMGMIL